MTMARARAADAWVSGDCRGRRATAHGGDEPHRHNHDSADDGRRQGRDLLFPVELRHAPVQAVLKIVGATACLT